MQKTVVAGLHFRYNNVYGTKTKALKAKAFKAIWLCSGARGLD